MTMSSRTHSLDVNSFKKQIKEWMRQNPQGAVTQKELPIHISNLSLTDPVSNKITRIQTTIAADGSKQRVAAKSKAVFA